MNRLLTKILTIAALALPLAASAVGPNYYRADSKLASGKWVKIRVAESGIQQITHEQLREWGFEDPSKVTVHGHGGVVGANDMLNSSIPDDLADQPVVYTDDRILFYGEANARASFGTPYTLASMRDKPVPVVERNNYADAGYYFITDCLERPEFEPIGFNPYSGNTYNYHYCVKYFEEELTNPFKVGQRYFGHNILTDGAVDISIPMVDRAFDTPQGNTVNARAVFVGSGDYMRMQLTYPNKASVILLSSYDENHHFSSNSTESGKSYVELNLDNTFKDMTFRAIPSATSSFTYVALDNFVFCYPRRNVVNPAEGSLLMMTNSITSGDVEVIEDATADILVWDVSDGFNVRPYVTEYDEDAAEMRFSVPKTEIVTSSNPHPFRAIAFDPKAEHQTVELVGEVANQNIHAMPVPDMVILTSKLCAAQAERLAQIHRDYIGHNVLVLREEEIYNEFSSGTPSPWGVRRMVKTFYDRGLFASPEGESPLRHFLLFGGGLYDYRALIPSTKIYADAGALLPVFETNDLVLMAFTTKSYAADCYFGMVGDSGLMMDYNTAIQQVNVGRIPALSESKAITAVDKILEYVSKAPTSDLGSRALLLADSGDAHAHLLNCESAANAFLSNLPGSTVVRAYNALYPVDANDGVYTRNAAIRALKSGVGFFSYAGHGKADAFSKYNIWNISSVNQNEYTTYPFTMLATCDAYGFDKGDTSIAEEMYFKKNGGAINVIAHCRTAYQEANEAFHLEVANAFASADTKRTTGDIYRIARQNTILNSPTVSNVFENTLGYNLCGDPGLPLVVSRQRVRITAINGNAFDSESNHTFVPLTKNSIEGYIAVDEDTDEVDEEFNGTVIVSLYESPIIRKTKSHAPPSGHVGDSETLCINTDEDLLAEVTASVVNGRFSTTLTPPLHSREGQYNRLTVFGYSADLSQHVATHSMNAVIDASAMPESPEDVTAPVISKFYIDTPDFANGDVVSNSFTAYAVVDADESGLRKSSASLGGTARVTIDSARNIPIFGTAMQGQADGSTIIACPVSVISDGRHEMSITVSDNVGNTSSRSIEFTVINAPATASIAMKETTAVEKATFELTHNFTGEPAGRIVVENAEGNTVFSSADVTFPYEWDLRDNEGNEVGSGVYTVNALMKSGLQYAATPKISIVVVK